MNFLIWVWTENAKKHIYNNKSLNILSQNIRSINCNMRNFTTLLQRAEITWDILVLSECWLRSAKLIPTLDNYNFTATTVHKSQNEGVVIYYNKHLNVTCEEPNINDANYLVLKLNQDTCILGIYRPPSYTNTTRFIDSLDLLLTSLKSFKNIFLCGDININIVPNSLDKKSYDYLNLLASHGMLPGHTLHGHTCLDHMILKTRMDALCLILETSITDHESVAMSCRLKSHITRVNKQYSTLDLENLDITIQNLNFHPILQCQDPNTATNLLVSYLSTDIKNHSRRVQTSTRKVISKPWITKGL